MKWCETIMTFPQPVIWLLSVNFVFVVFFLMDFGFHRDRGLFGILWTDSLWGLVFGSIIWFSYRKKGRPESPKRN